MRRITAYRGPMVDVAAFYRFADIGAPEAVRARLDALGRAAGLRGTVLVAAEGVNGTVAGPRDGLERFFRAIRSVPGLEGLSPRYSMASDMPFARLKVRLKREIVTMGMPGLRPADGTGTYVAPSEWNALVREPDVVTIDTRNAYEVRLGTFDGAVDPGIESFGDFPEWWAAQGERFQCKRIAMFCTGGIRCEKSTAYLRGLGLTEVFHLEGGILSYLDTVPEAESLWRGECFVFDQRVALRHGLSQGDAAMCHACRRPVTPADMARDSWEEGVSCPACIAEFTEADRARFRERQKQIRLARARGERHMA